MTPLLIVLVAATNAAANTPWAPESVNQYVARCTSQAIAQNQVPKGTAEGICRCVAGGMSRKFGMEGIDRMMKAKAFANPNRTPDERRLYNIFNRCWPATK